ncbi:MAG: DUF4381 domain-containing protein [Verrucomicrobia subdivision 3 bacterium]|nr:DUF4381 domain-containing protein [Limisphaerales bacterium]
MNTNAASLDRLHDIVVPSAVSWWPPAPGWDWVLGFVLVLVLVAGLRTFVRWQHNRYRREALAELERLEDQWKNAAERAATLLALSELLKRTALTVFPREDVATLTGTKWFEFLDRTGHAKLFNSGLGAALANATYASRTASFDDTKLNEFVTAIRHWIKHHDPRIQQKDAKTAKSQPTNKALLPSLKSSV